MAFQSVWFFTGLPVDIIKILEKDLIENFDSGMKDSLLHGDKINKDKRNSKNSWIPTDHWIAGWLWHYVQKANRTNFLYDLTHIECESIQYAQYGVGDYYNWHNDAGLINHHKPNLSNVATDSILDDRYLKEKTIENNEFVRKISFSLQLSDPDDYEGGNIQLLDECNKNYIAPRQKGSLIIFDSRTQHRVCKVTKGIRKSIVGWVVGPRWK